MVEINGYCVNCLARSHDLRACRSMDTCRKCDKYHHTLLHPQKRRERGLIDASQRRSQQQNPRPQQNQRQRQQQSQRQQENQQNAEMSTPDAKILSEAIRSLAQVLCCSTQQPNTS